MTKKEYEKTALTIDEQVDLLRKRGIIIEDENEAKYYLNNISYYHLSGYFKFFQQKDDSFHEGTTFIKVLDLYFFDRKLRLLFLNALERIEKSFKTQFILHVSTKHGANALMEHETFEKHREKIEENLQKTKEPFIKKFFEKYSNNHPPLWILAEVLSFGDILYIFSRSVETEEKKIISDYYKLGWRHLYSWLENLREVRNICAHHSRLWNRKITKHLKKGRRYNEIQYNYRLFDSIIITAILLQTISPTFEWVEEVTNLIEEYKIDVKMMGFPKNWEEIFEKYKKG